MKKIPFLGAAIVLVAALFMSSCTSVEKAAPPVATLGLASSPHAGKLEQGRCIYTGKCTKCHSPEPITEHAVSDWNEDILPSMTKKAKLSAEECECLKSYVMAVCSRPPAKS